MTSLLKILQKYAAEN